MRVLYLAQEFPNKTRPYACTFLLEQAKAISRLVDVAVLAPVRLYPSFVKYDKLREELHHIPLTGRMGNLEIYHPRYRYLPGPLRFVNIYNFMRSVKRVVTRYVGKIDIIHAHFAHAAGFAGIKLSSVFNVPIVVTVHGSDINRFLLNGEGEWYFKERALKTLFFADKIVAVSNDLEKKVCCTGNFAKKTERIYNGIDMRIFKAGDKYSARKKLCLPKAKKILLSAGNIIPEKGVFDIVDALEILNRDDVATVFIGNDGTFGQFSEKIKNMRNIYYHGPVSAETVALYMQACDLLVHPSYAEGFGLVVAESLACGCPVVASRVGGIPEIISSAELGMLIEPGNPTQLAGAIGDGLSRQWDPEKLISRAQEFSFENHLAQLIPLYERLLESV